MPNKGFGVLSQFNYVINDSLSADVGVDVEYTEGELTQSQDSVPKGQRSWWKPYP